MSYQTTNPTSQLNFKVKAPSVPVLNPSNTPFLTSGVADKSSQGEVSKTIDSSALLGNTLYLEPGSAGQIYTLPTASSLLNQFGRSIDTGVPKTSAGNMLVFNVVNRSQYPATLLSSPTGGDGSSVICATATNGASPVQYGKVTKVYLEWLSVSGSLSGATGTYTLYN